MKKLNQKGFSVVEIIIVVVVIGLLGAVGWLVYDRQNNKTANSNSTSSQTTQNTQQKPTSESSDSKNIDTSIHDVDIKMQTAADISKLPDYTPASFKAYMLELLKDNKYSYNQIDDVNTITQYQVTKISQVNIIGGMVPVDKNGDGHAGGAPAIWVLTPKGTWDEETLNGPVCKSKNGGLIYEEFEKECYAGSNTTTLVKNPNGSITSIND